MGEPSKVTQSFPPEVTAIRERGYAVWAGDQLSEDFRSRFDVDRIPVVAVRHVRLWGLQIDDEKELPGRERTSIPDEELWEVRLRAKDDSTYEVDASLLVPAPG